MPAYEIAIFTDDLGAIPPGLFDSVEIIKEPSYSFMDRIKCLSKTPFKSTLFLDTDTYIVESFPELFELLGRFDIAYAHAPCRDFNYGVMTCPKSFPPPQAGVLLFNNNRSIMALLRKWLKLFKKQLIDTPKFTNDQPALGQAMYNSNVKFTILAPEYNLRTEFPCFIGGNARAKILHGRGISLEGLKPIVNKSFKPRVFNA